MDRTSLGRREGTGVSRSMRVVIKCSQVPLVFLLCLGRQRCDFMLLRNKQNRDLGGHDVVLDYQVSDIMF